MKKTSKKPSKVVQLLVHKYFRFNFSHNTISKLFKRAHSLYKY